MYLWIMMIVLGAVVLETFMIYPNIFADPPGSLARALDFMRVTAPHDFFPPLGLLSWVTAAATLVLTWPVRTVRIWVLISSFMIVADGLVSMMFQWPRNEIMFVQGPAVHSAAVLIQTARDFERLHWLRVLTTALAATAIFVGFLRLYRHQLLSDRSNRI